MQLITGGDLGADRARTAPFLAGVGKALAGGTRGVDDD
jgi:hypothetical protein